MTSQDTRKRGGRHTCMSAAMGKHFGPVGLFHLTSNTTRDMFPFRYPISKIKTHQKAPLADLSEL